MASLRDGVDAEEADKIPEEVAEEEEPIVVVEETTRGESAA